MARLFYADTLGYLCILLMSGQAPAAQEVKPAGVIQRPAQTPRKTYNETADAKAQIAAAVKAAAEDDIRVLINWGANDDARCTGFAQVLRTPEVAEPRFFSDEYKVVAVDVGRLDKNQDVARTHGARLDAGALPHFTILDKSGNVLAQASAREFSSEADPAGFDPKKVAAFLARNRAAAADARPLFDAALTTAKHDNKYVFLWFSAPW